MRLVDSDVSLRPIWRNKDLPDVIEQMKAETLFQQDHDVKAFIIREEEIATQRAKVLQKHAHVVPIVLDFAFALAYEVDEQVSYELSEKARREYEYEAKKDDEAYHKVNDFLLLKSLEELHAEALRLTHDFVFGEDTDMVRVGLSTILAKPFIRRDVRKEIPKESADIVAPHLNVLAFVGVNGDLEVFADEVLPGWANELAERVHQHGEKFVQFVNETKKPKQGKDGKAVKRQLTVRGLDDDIISIDLAN